jgi:hypothetical protein
MPNRVDINSTGKKADAGKAAKGGKADNTEAKGNAIKLAVVAVCLVLAGTLIWYNFLRTPPVPPPQPSFDPLAELPPEERKREERRLELLEQELKKNPPAGA